MSHSRCHLRIRSEASGNWVGNTKLDKPSIDSHKPNGSPYCIQQVASMDLQWFIPAFDRAVDRCRTWAQCFVLEELPESIRFNFAAMDRQVDATGRIKYLGGRLLHPKQLQAVTKVTARKYLWVDGKVPAWINLTVRAADHEHTYIEVCSTDRLVAKITQMYHLSEGNPPFHILGPPVPPWWVSVAESGKFSLNWEATTDGSLT